VSTGEPIAAANSALCSIAVDPHESARRPGDRRFGSHRHLSPLERLRDVCDCSAERVGAPHVPRREAELEAAPRAALEAVGELVGLWGGLEKKNRGHGLLLIALSFASLMDA
jgi:hypothetical protein